MIFVVGSRTFAAEVVGYAWEAGVEVGGLLEPFERGNVGTMVHGLEVHWLEDGPPGAHVVIGTGDRDRQELAERLVRAGLEPVALVHPSAHVAATSNVAPGAIVAPGVVVGGHSTVGDHAVLGRGTLVGHHTEIAPFATLGPGTNVAGNVRIGRGAVLGMAAVIRDHLTVGAGAEVGMGALVLSDVGERVRVRGFPAREIDPTRPTGSGDVSRKSA